MNSLNSREAHFADFKISLLFLKQMRLCETRMFTISCSSDWMQNGRIAELSTRLK